MGETLFLVHRAPWPPDRGDRIRSWHMALKLAELGPLHIIAFADSETDRRLALPKLEGLAASAYVEVRRTGRVAGGLRALSRLQPLSLGLFHSPAMQAAVDLALASGRIDRIVAFSSQMAQFVRRDFAGRFVMDFVDVDSAKFAAYARADRLLSPMRWVHGYEGWRLAAWEAAVARRADASLFVSEAEAALFRAAQADGGAGRVHALGNGIDLDRFSPEGDWTPLDAAAAAGPLLIFTGQMDYRPNIEAVTHFAHDILPLVRRSHGDAHFAIVGRAPTPSVLALADLPGVVVTGEVPDTRPWLGAASVVVAPLAVARGVQNKLLEAMAMARAVVASPSAAQGIDAVPGRDLVVADGASDTADAIADLLSDPARRDAMGAAARVRMVAAYGWDAALAPLAGHLATGHDRAVA